METEIIWSCKTAEEIDRENSEPCPIVLLFFVIR